MVKAKHEDIVFRGRNIPSWKDELNHKIKLLNERYEEIVKKPKYPVESLDRINETIFNLIDELNKYLTPLSYTRQKLVDELKDGVKEW